MNECERCGTVTPRRKVWDDDQGEYTVLCRDCARDVYYCRHGGQVRQGHED